MVTAEAAEIELTVPLAKTTMPMAAPKAAPWETPKVEAEASGLRRTHCMTAPEAEAWLSERLDYLKAVAVWREWADNAEAWNEEDRAAFKERNREILSRYPDLDIEESSLRYLRSFYNEQHLLSEILEQVSAVAHYEDYLNRIGEEAKIMTSSSLFGKPGTFSYRNIEKTPPVYEHLKGTVLPAEDSEGMLLATGSRITDLLLLCLFVVLGLSMLIGEREDGTLLLIKPMKRGYLDTIAAKLALMLCLAAAGTVLFYGTDFLIAEKTLGLGDLSRPVQSLRGFLTSPYAMTAGQYLAGEFRVLEMDEYVRLVCQCIGHLSEKTVIHHLTGDGPSDELIAPLWSRKKLSVLNAIHHELKEQGISQGCLEGDTYGF